MKGQMMKILFIGDLQDPSSSGMQRYWALKQCEIEVVLFDKKKYRSKKFGKFGGIITKLLKMPVLAFEADEMAKDLIKLAEIEQPHLIWIEWPREFRVSTIMALKAISSKPYLISFQDDNPWGKRLGDKWMWKEYFKVVPYFDLHLVKRETDKENLGRLGATNCQLWHHGIYSPLYHPALQKVDKIYPVSFVGTSMDNRGDFIEKLLNAGIDIHIFGSLWKKRFPKLVQRFPNNFHDPVVGDAYADTIRKSLLSLILISESNMDEWTMRSYEVPGCGTTPLVYRTPTHERMFTHDVTAYFFSSAEECANLIHLAVKNEEKSIAIGENAQRFFTLKQWFIEIRTKELVADLIRKYEHKCV